MHVTCSTEVHVGGGVWLLVGVSCEHSASVSVRLVRVVVCMSPTISRGNMLFVQTLVLGLDIY